MKIIKISKEQLPVIRQLAYEIWPIAYKDILSEAQLHYMLEKFYAVYNLENLLIHESQVFMLLESENKNIGFASYELNCNHLGTTKLHKIYIRPDIQRKNIGSFLLSEIEKIARENKQHTIFLNVNRNNNARYFYEKMGYKITESVDIEIGEGYLMEDYVMHKNLIDIL